MASPCGWSRLSAPGEIEDRLPSAETGGCYGSFHQASAFLPKKTHLSVIAMRAESLASACPLARIVIPFDWSNETTSPPKSNPQGRWPELQRLADCRSCCSI